MHPVLHLRVHYKSSVAVLYVDSTASASCLHRMSSSRSHQLEDVDGVITISFITKWKNQLRKQNLHLTL